MVTGKLQTDQEMCAGKDVASGALVIESGILEVRNESVSWVYSSEQCKVPICHHIYIYIYMMQLLDWHHNNMHHGRNAPKSQCVLLCNH